MRTLLVTGPGGAGSSTLSVAAAVQAARAGERTALITRRPPAVAGLDAVAGLRVGPDDVETRLRGRAGRRVLAGDEHGTAPGTGGTHGGGRGEGRGAGPAGTGEQQDRHGRLSPRRAS